MGQDVILHFGELEKREWPEYPIGNILLTGVCGSGKTVVLTNLLSELILRYDVNDIVLNVWDGHGVDFVKGKGKYGIEYCNIARSCANFAESNIMDFVTARYEFSSLRKKLISEAGCGSLKQYNEVFEDKPMPVEITVFEELQATLTKMDEEKSKWVIETIKHMLEMSDLTGHYILLSSQGLDMIEDLLEDNCKLFDVVACTRGTEELSRRLFKSTVASSIMMKQYGSICVRDKNKDINIMDVPFYYNTKTIRGIINQRTLPQGTLFDTYKMWEWAKFIQGCYGEISGLPEGYHADDERLPIFATKWQTRGMTHMFNPQGTVQGINAPIQAANSHLREFTPEELAAMKQNMPSMDIAGTAAKLGVTKEEAGQNV